MIPAKPKVHVVVLNYQAWPDTLECLESVVACDYPDFEVVVVDNGSPDPSVEKILAWARGDLRPPIPAKSPLPAPAKKIPAKIPCVLRDGRGGLLREEPGDAGAPPLTVIASEKDWGCYGGFAVGIRWCRKQADFRYAWILNNDTAVKSDALSRLVARAQEDGLGICGARIAYYDAPEKTQALAGRFDFLSGRNHEIKDMARIAEMNYVVGTAMLASRACLEAAPLPEEYFLYLEDVDFCFAARAAGIRLGVAFDAVVYHKAGIGSTSVEKEYYFARNLLHFTWKFRPWTLPFALWYVLGHRAAMKVLGGRARFVGALLRGTFDFLRGRMGERV